MITPFDLSSVDEIVERHRHKNDALITMLQESQRAYGYLPKEVILRLSRGAKIPLNRIYGVATFYSQFYLTPRGKNIVQVCRGTACHVRGSSVIMSTLADSLGVEESGTTEDMQFTLEAGACVGTCSLAPVVVVNGSFHGKLDPVQARDIIRAYASAGEQA
ncbi:MAG: NAD(P)H-dependent oxidoreductase subunit E [SAR202 cluster bacterium]|jgi:NADH:ubiquinone oxidoreductase subunit E|nr:NAD(P)H-dependent oxidoreductase subunit E [Chloroflexota bacterium]MDP6422229.1 NAD(P)H-dependent oxidoreductase subunit E [SAR202 cluster bacterium]HAL49411.1 NAD(P)H-dependent oxidoreductase subunit E [Dehalococcoidia bacterium]MDP6662691.1 NAD(P)H-dependent oxidoreductase subunit E [SAR202 cluster bacterium]MDP6799458.1 NAD(P)H-dependent oxidoreductase subunit E [SAR202 cluster bacterium]|tara:strand:- start:2718 stop:3200 length:483 start_codon:yes stop_codon:yes gene_type:complete